MSRRYIWHNKSGGVKYTKDSEGKIPIMVELPCGVTTCYMYYRGTDILKFVEYFKNDEYHRDDDKPAYVWYREDGGVTCEVYYKNGRRHRDDDKPARVWYYTDGSVEGDAYYKNGVEYTPLSKVS